MIIGLQKASLSLHKQFENSKTMHKDTNLQNSKFLNLGYPDISNISEKLSRFVSI